MYATEILSKLRLSKTFLKVWCSSKVLFLSNINMKLWKIAFCCVCSSHKHSNNASVWEYLVKFWHYRITYCKSSLHRYLLEVRNVEISRATQQLVCSKSHDFLAVFALAHSKINQIAWNDLGGFWLDLWYFFTIFKKWFSPFVIVFSQSVQKKGLQFFLNVLRLSKTWYLHMAQLS